MRYTGHTELRCDDRRECRYFQGYYAFKKRERKRKAGRFFKWLTGLVVGHGMICVSMSYILAWTEHTQVVEGVSTTIVTEIIAPVIVYGATKTIENIFQKNRLSFSTPLEAEEKVDNKVDNTSNESEVCG